MIIEETPYTVKTDRVVEAMEVQKKLTSKSRHIFLTEEGHRMNPDHFREVVWKRALKKAGLDYRPPIQTRHTFATMMLSAGEDIGWVQNMMGYASLQMIFTRYYAWIPKKTRSDGMAFMNLVERHQKIDTTSHQDGDGKVIRLFEKVSQFRHTPTPKNFKGLQT